MVDIFRYLDSGKRSIYLFGMISTTCLMTGNLLFFSSNLWFVPFGVYIFFTFVYLCMSYAVGILSKDPKISPPQSCTESVDVFLPVCGEPLHVLRNTWEGVKELEGNIVVYVLDDGRDDKIKDMAMEFGFNYLTRDDNTLKKAGNLRAAFSKTFSPFILILDADFRPVPAFLQWTLRYFFEDDRIAIVQTPQWFKHDPQGSWIKNAAGAIQELFYRLIQVNRDHFGGAICVGTNAVYRRSALEPYGGTYPIEYSEDVHTGFQLISDGWKLKYIPIILANGLCPDTVKQYFTQQYRWSLGSISLFFSRKFWSAQITFMQRICYLTGMLFYMTTGIGVLFMGVPSIIMLAFFPDKIMWHNLLFALPSFVYSTVFMYFWMIEKMDIHVLRARHLSYYAHLFALKDFLLNSLEEWKPTGAKTGSKRFDQFSLFYKIHTVIIVTVTTSLFIYRINDGVNIADLSLMIAFFIYHMVIAVPLILKNSET